MIYDSIIILPHESDEDGNLLEDSLLRSDLAIELYNKGYSKSILTLGWDYRNDSNITFLLIVSDNRTEPHYHIYTIYRRPFWNMWQALDINLAIGNICNFTSLFKIKVVMFTQICIEISATGLNNYFTQQPGRFKLMESVIYCGQGNQNIIILCGFM